MLYLLSRGYKKAMTGGKKEKKDLSWLFGKAYIIFQYNNIMPEKCNSMK